VTPNIRVEEEEKEVAAHLKKTTTARVSFAEVEVDGANLYDNMIAR
jgi:hypothetical protein